MISLIYITYLLQKSMIIKSIVFLNYRQHLKWTLIKIKLRFVYNATYRRVASLRRRFIAQNNRAFTQQRRGARKVWTTWNIAMLHNTDGAVLKNRKSIFTMLLIVPLMLVSKFNTNDKSKSLFPNGTGVKITEKDTFFVENNIRISCYKCYDI